MAKPAPQTQARPHDNAQRGMQRPERPGQTGQGPYTRMESTSETAILRTCLDTVSETFTYCIEEGGAHVEPAHLKCMLDCWDVVNATSSLIARKSEYAEDLKEICARAVKACEESCETFEDDERMTACVDVCRKAYENLTGEEQSGSSGNPDPNKGKFGEEE